MGQRELTPSGVALERVWPHCHRGCQAIPIINASRERRRGEGRIPPCGDSWK